MADLLGFWVENGPALLRGIVVTIAVTLTGVAAGFALAVAMAALASAAPRRAGRAVGLYVTVFRDTPFIVQLFFLFFGLPAIGIQLGAFAAAVLAVTLNLGAYATEMIRAGLAALPAGQGDAGRALGLHPAQIFALVRLPQALAVSYPALASQAVLALLDTAVVSQIALADLAFQGDMIQSRSFRAFETYVTITLIYLALSLLLRRGIDRLSRRLRARAA